MDDQVRDATETLLERKPALRDDVETLLERDQDGAWTFQDVAVDSGAFSGVRTIGEGTLRAADGCLIFSPGWSADQRLFALAGVPEAAGRVAGTDSVVRVEGTLRGYSLCGTFGSVPTVQVAAARPTGGTGAGYYPVEGDVPPSGGTSARLETETDTATDATRDTTRGAR